MASPIRCRVQAACLPRSTCAVRSGRPIQAAPAQVETARAEGRTGPGRSGPASHGGLRRHQGGTRAGRTLVPGRRSGSGWSGRACLRPGRARPGPSHSGRPGPWPGPGPRQARTPARVAHPGPWPRATRLRLTPPRTDLFGRRGEGAPPAPSPAAPGRPSRAAVNRANYRRKPRCRPVPREHRADPCEIPAGACKNLHAKRGRLTPPLPPSPGSRCRRNHDGGTSSGCSARAPRTTGRPPPGSS